jgi:hypothetical protein
MPCCCCVYGFRIRWSARDEGGRCRRQRCANAAFGSSNGTSTNVTNFYEARTPPLIRSRCRPERLLHHRPGAGARRLPQRTRLSGRNRRPGQDRIRHLPTRPASLAAVRGRDRGLPVGWRGLRGQPRHRPCHLRDWPTPCPPRSTSPFPGPSAGGVGASSSTTRRCEKTSGPCATVCRSRPLIARSPTGAYIGSKHRGHRRRAGTQERADLGPPTSEGRHGGRKLGTRAGASVVTGALMTGIGSYSSATAFRQALEDRLKAEALQTGVPYDRLRKEAAFHRLLARLQRVAPKTAGA